MPLPSSKEDPVLREYPVFMSKALLGQLYLIQHPLIPADVSFVDQIVEAKIKPNQDRIQLKLEIDTETRYDIDKGEFLAAAAAGITEFNDDAERPILSEHTMESKPLPGSANSTRYVAGVLRDGQIHLAPLKSIVQMKDTLPFLDEADENRKKPGSKDSEVPEEATKITQKFTQARPGALNTKYRNTYNSFKKTQESEPWIELNYYTKDFEEFNKLFSGTAESDTPFYVISKKDYFEAIFPKHVKVSPEGEKAATEKVNRAKKASIYHLKRLPLPDQLRNIMINAKILSHSQLVNFLQTKLRIAFDEVSLLKSIQTVAVLVQGTWVVKSDLIYPKDFISEANGISGSRMQDAREIILCQYTKTRLVTRSQMCNLTQLPNAEVTEILVNLARVIRQTGWEFKYPIDIEFMMKYPELTERQATMWQMKDAKRTRASSSNPIPIKQEHEDSLKMKPPVGFPSKRRISRDTPVGLDQFEKQDKIGQIQIKQEKVDKPTRRLRSRSRSTESD